MKDGSLFVWGKNDRGQLGVGSGIGIDMVESESTPVQIGFEGGLVKDFNTGMNTMLVQTETGEVWKTGLKLDYQPKKIALPADFLPSAESGVSPIQGLTCGRRHYALWNGNNQVLVWGNVIKEKAQSESDGFGLYFGNSLFEGGRIRQLSMKYGIFGALVEHDAAPGEK
jgi:hypothetical protein